MTNIDNVYIFVSMIQTKPMRQTSKDTDQNGKLQKTIRVPDELDAAIIDISGHETTLRSQKVSKVEAGKEILTLGVKAWDRLNPGKLKKELREILGLSGNSKK